MYAKKIRAVTWVSQYAEADPERCFDALYVFDDGFPSEAKCKETLKFLGYVPNRFALVYFCKQWYAVNMNSYRNFVVVSAENVIFQVENFSSNIIRVPIKAAINGKNPAADIFDTDEKLWADGIYKDLNKIDHNIKIKVNNRNVTKNAIIANNVLITLGREFFRTEICIRTREYTNAVFSNYYNDNSMRWATKNIDAYRRSGQEYYNPFTGDTSRNAKQRDMKVKELLSRCKSYDDLTNEKDPDEEKVKPRLVTHEPKGDSKYIRVKVEDIGDEACSESAIVTIHGVEHYLNRMSVVLLCRELALYLKDQQKNLS